MWRLDNLYLKLHQYLRWVWDFDIEFELDEFDCTGASGFVGLELAHQLLTQGYTVRAVTQDASEFEMLQPLGAALAGKLELTALDMREEGAFDQVVQGATYVWVCSVRQSSSCHFLFDLSAKPAANSWVMARNFKSLILLQEFRLLVPERPLNVHVLLYSIYYNVQWPVLPNL